MVDGVVHNACMHIEDAGEDLDQVLPARGSRRWLGRTGIAAGAAASLAVGAVLGGVLEGVPVLFPPVAGASASPDVGHTHSTSGSPFKLASIAGVASAAHAAAGALPAGGSDGSGGRTGVPELGTPAGGSTIVQGAPDNSGNVGTTTPGIPTTPITTNGQANQNLVEQALNTAIGGTSGPPVVGGTLSGVLGAIGGVVSGVVSSAPAAPTPGSPTTPPSSGSTVVSGAVNCVTSLLSLASKNCPVNTVTAAVGLR